MANPLGTREEIAKEAEIPGSTVQRRLTHLRESGSLECHWVLAPNNLFFPLRSLIGLNVKSEGLSSNEYGYHNQPEFVSFLMWGLTERTEFSEIMANVVLERADVVLGGPTDLIIIISAVDAKALAAFLTLILRTLPGVLGTNTATLVSYPKSLWKSHKNKLPNHKKGKAGE